MKNPYWKFDERYASLHQQDLPRAVRHIGLILLAIFVMAIGLLMWMPWVQTTSGFGELTAIDPSKRQQDIHTLVAGRVDEWFVRDGDRVSKGQPIVRISDNDPRLLERLDAELAAMRTELQAAELAATTAAIDYKRKTDLSQSGLASQRELEQARIRLQERRATESSAQARVARASVAQAQLTQQTVQAPSDGTIIRTTAADTATYVSRGATVATFLPNNDEPAVAIHVSGRDVPLVRPGRKVRLQFDGWPAVQFSGWPSVAIGTFGGVVAVVEGTAMADGRFRVFVVPDPDDAPWPDEQFLRFGAKARGWVLLDEVSLGYELWRVLNQFPPNFVAEPEQT